MLFSASKLAQAGPSTTNVNIDIVVLGREARHVRAHDMLAAVARPWMNHTGRVEPAAASQRRPAPQQRLVESVTSGHLRGNHPPGTHMFFKEGLNALRNDVTIPSNAK